MNLPTSVFNRDLHGFSLTFWINFFFACAGSSSLFSAFYRYFLLIYHEGANNYLGHTKFWHCEVYHEEFKIKNIFANKILTRLAFGKRQWTLLKIISGRDSSIHKISDRLWLFGVRKKCSADILSLWWRRWNNPLVPALDDRFPHHDRSWFLRLRDSSTEKHINKQ